MKKSIWWIVGIVVVILIIVGVSANNKSSQSKPIKIGVILPLSGDLAMLGEPAQKAAQFALDNYPGTKNQYQLIFEDDQFNGSKTVTAANKLISIDKVNAIISFASTAGNVVNPLATQNMIIHFAVASDPKIADGKYNFNHWTPPSEEARVMVQQLKERGINKIGLFTGNQAGMLAVANELKSQLNGTGISVVSDLVFNIGEKDFKTLIAKAQPSNAQVYVLFCFTPELELLAKQMKDAGVKTPLTAIESFDQTNQPELFNGYWYVSASDPSSSFVDQFKQKFGQAPSFGTANVYDIIGMIVTAIESDKSSGTPNADQISLNLHNLKDYKGAMGDLSIGDNGLVLSQATVKTVKVK